MRGGDLWEGGKAKFDTLFPFVVSVASLFLNTNWIQILFHLTEHVNGEIVLPDIDKNAGYVQMTELLEK